MNTSNENLRASLTLGDPQVVAELIAAGADIHYRTEYGYDALMDAVGGRDALHDARLIELLTLLLDHGVSLTGRSAYGQSGVFLFSCLGRFDAVQFLLKAGADPAELGFTELMDAVAFGTLADVKNAVRKDVDLEAQDSCWRTAWHIAIQIGDIPKAQFLAAHGSNVQAQGRCEEPPLFYAIESGHTPMLRWLLEIGLDIHQTDEFGHTALAKAVESGNVEAIKILLQAGADVNQKVRTWGALYDASTRDVAMTLLAAGADPQELSSEGRRAILGYPSESDPEALQVSVEEFRKYRARRFGTHNPEPMNNPVWEGMIRSGLNAYLAAVRIEGERNYGTDHGPFWCADRFGQSLTFLDDGRIIQIGGEHEDRYDPDFCIYNDVFVHDSDGIITIYGYPKRLFPPTDFHTATLLGKYIYVIGSLGYYGKRRPGETPVCRLDTDTFQITPLKTTGDNPGWIYKHRAMPLNSQEIRVAGGTIVTREEGEERYLENTRTFILNIETLMWSVDDAKAA